MALKAHNHLFFIFFIFIFLEVRCHIGQPLYLRHGHRLRGPQGGWMELCPFVRVYSLFRALLQSGTGTTPSPLVEKCVLCRLSLSQYCGTCGDPMPLQHPLVALSPSRGWAQGILHYPLKLSQVVFVGLEPATLLRPLTSVLGRARGGTSTKPP